MKRHDITIYLPQNEHVTIVKGKEYEDGWLCLSIGTGENYARIDYVKGEESKVEVIQGMPFITTSIEPKKDELDF